jgi:hypothetical protein
LAGILAELKASLGCTQPQAVPRSTSSKQATGTVDIFNITLYLKGKKT